VRDSLLFAIHLHETRAVTWSRRSEPLVLLETLAPPELPAIRLREATAPLDPSVASEAVRILKMKDAKAALDFVRKLVVAEVARWGRTLGARAS